MAHSLTDQARDQLRLVKAILDATLTCDELSTNHERITLALERLSVIDELLVDAAGQAEQAVKRSNELETVADVASQEIKPRRTETADKSIAESSVRRDIQIFPDQGVIDSYSDLVRTHGELTRVFRLLCGEIETAIRNINDFWTGNDEAKAIVLEKLRTALVAK
jgi:hypothetical protein